MKIVTNSLNNAEILVWNVPLWSLWGARQKGSLLISSHRELAHPPEQETLYQEVHHWDMRDLSGMLLLQLILLGSWVLSGSSTISIS